MLQNRRRRPKNFRGLHGSCLQKNIKEVRAYFEDEGADIAGMSNADLAESRGSFCNPGRQISDRGSVGMTFLWNTLCQNTDACEKSVNRTNRQVRGKKNETI